MSEQPKTRPKVPEGKTRFLKTRQMAPNEKGYVGYETIWESFQKETRYDRRRMPAGSTGLSPKKRIISK